MKKFVIAAALIAAPTLTFAGGYGSDLSQYQTGTADFVTNFDPSVSAEARQPEIAAIGAKVDTGMIKGGAVQTSTVNIQEEVATSTRRVFRPVISSSANDLVIENRFETSSLDITKQRQDAARAKLLRYRNLNR